MLPATKFRSPQLTHLAVADSKEKKKFRAFSVDLVMWSCVLAYDVAALLNGGNGGEWWQLLLSPCHSNILEVFRPQTNSDSVCASVCVRVKCSLTLSTCLSNELALQQNVRQERKFQAQRDLRCLWQVRGAVVNRV